MNADRLNLAALVVALVLAAVGPLLPAMGERKHPSIVTLEGSSPSPGVIVDASGVPIPAGPYRRIVSLHLVADHLLHEMIEAERLVGVTVTSKSDHPDGWRFAQSVGLDTTALEAILAQRPDLVIVSNFADAALRARLDERDVTVFDLGEMRGVQSTLEDIRVLGALLQVDDRAASLADRYGRELAALDAVVPNEAAAPGLYLSVYGDAYFGGTAGTSYADLLRYGGVRDVAAEEYRGWPRYTPEQLLTLDPELIVTQRGMGRAICGNGTLSELTACGEQGRIVELPGRYHTDPGLGLVQAAAAVQRLVHPERTLLIP